MALRLAKAVSAGLALGLLLPGLACAQDRPAGRGQPAETVTVTGPTVIAFWLVPGSDSVLEADPGLASELDEQQYWWSATRPLLDSVGIGAVDRPGRAFTIREPSREWTFAAHPDSAATGFLFLRPGGSPRVAYGRHFPDEVLAIARAAFSATPDR